MVLIKRAYDLFKESLITTRVQEVYNTFIDYYGEEYVDIGIDLDIEYFKDIIYDSFHNLDIKTVKQCLQDFNSILEEDKKIAWLKRNCPMLEEYKAYILVYFPEITVTNENDRSVNIQELYIKVKVTSMGIMGKDFLMIRTRFPYDQYISNYSHSHAPSAIDRWQSMCLGRGPLVTTCHTLKHTYDLDIWSLFCVELDQYLKRESIAGTPYRYLERIEEGSTIQYSPSTNSTYRFGDSLFKEFIKYVIKDICTNNIDKLACVNKAIDLGCSSIDFALYASKLFIKYYNEYIVREYPTELENIKNKYLIKGCLNMKGNIVIPSNYGGIYPERRYLLTFKGCPQYLSVDAPTKEVKTSLLLAPTWVTILISYVLAILNYELSTKYNITFNSEKPYFI